MSPAFHWHWPPPRPVRWWQAQSARSLRLIRGPFRIGVYAVDTCVGDWHWVIDTATHEVIASAPRKLPTRAAAKRAALRALKRWRWEQTPEAKRFLAACEAVRLASAVREREMLRALEAAEVAKVRRERAAMVAEGAT